MTKFVAKFEKDFSLVSCISTSAIPKKAWYEDNGASRHMTSVRQLFSSLKKKDSRVQVELGDDAKYPIAGVGTIPFQLESSNSLDLTMSCLYQVSRRICFQFRLWKIRALQWSSRTSKSSSDRRNLAQI
jgi:hypothetical protein